MLEIVGNNSSASPWMECMLEIVGNNSSASPWMECMLEIVGNNSSASPWMEWLKTAHRHTASLLLHCPNKLHPCNDAFSALPASMQVVC
jgi:hypothetical protein